MPGTRSLKEKRSFTLSRSSVVYLERLKRDELITRPRDSRTLHMKLQTNIRSGDKVLMTKESPTKSNQVNRAPTLAS